jgi:lipoprotein-releasing system permease protein
MLRTLDLPFELHIALRYLLAKRKQAFISVISIISTLGVTVGVMAVIVALAVMTGLQQELQKRILGSNPHIFVFKHGGIEDYRAEAAKLSATPGVIGAAPEVLGKALVTTAGTQEFVSFKGIDPGLEPAVTDIEGAMRTGSLAALAQESSDGLDGIVLGSDLANGLHVVVGDIVSVVTPGGSLSPMGMMPHTRRLRVVGTFTLGFYEFDSTYGLVSLDVAKRLLDTTHVEMIQLRVNDIYAAPQIAQALKERMGPDYSTQDWAEMNKPLFSALWLEKIAVSLAIFLIVMVAALNIVASLILLVMEKNRDIAILKTMGASARSVTAIFMAQGLIIGLLGTTAGAAAGCALSYILDRYKLIRVSADIYQVSYLPFTVLPGNLTIVVIVAVLVCFVATVYPSRQAARLDPAQALRYE